MLCIENCIVTIDAMGTQKDIAKKIIEKKADYILQIKENQPALLQDIDEYFKKDVFTLGKKDLEAQAQYFKDLSGDHGRLEIREYYTANHTDRLAERHPEWTGLCGIGACMATVEENGSTSSSVSYSIFSLSDITAEEYGTRKREHWNIENSLHRVLDIGFREDESRIRKGNAAENMNIVRHIGLNLLKQDKSCKMGITSR